VHFEFFASSLTVYILPICLPGETAEIETGMAEKSNWDQANIVNPAKTRINRKKIS
jgi:hypothetical protein